MKQIIQDLRNGNTILEEVPVPSVKPGSVLIKTTRTLVSLFDSALMKSVSFLFIFMGAAEENLR